jgi:molybdopterin molybdotransferase
MIEYGDALRRVLKAAKPLGSESVPISAALGRILGRDIRARESVPPFAKATMDGYAVRATDSGRAGARGPVELEIVEDLPAGRVSRRAIGPGQAARIMTGAPLPKGADAVVMVEDTRKAGGWVRILSPVRRGDNVGLAGEDVRKGDLVLERGGRLGPAEVGMLAALGYGTVPVSKCPRVAVVATGDEIVEPGRKAKPGQIRNSNGHSLRALAAEAGAGVEYLGIARDRNSSLKLKIGRARKADILVLSGGVSVGDHDLVKEELQGLGVRPVFWRVRIKPGRPVFFGVRGRQLVFGLPGNPASAMVTFHLFVRPAIDRMLGRKNPGLRSGTAVLHRKIELKPGRLQFLRASLVGDGPELRVDPFPDQRSGVLSSMVRSRVLIVVPPEVARIEKDRAVGILHLD